MPSAQPSSAISSTSAPIREKHTACDAFHPSPIPSRLRTPQNDPRNRIHRPASAYPRIDTAHATSTPSPRKNELSPSTHFRFLAPDAVEHCQLSVEHRNPALDEPFVLPRLLLPTR
ncbi:hypothetical protein EIP91_002252 [Steccherinum ochraceum]|uniref:Uncharacterized protein n=1 Tax=Steccherinum ochraceum TaxID=92696 RepID=A0A4R0RG66_9APHY|nr:hypothetical protein EIP91_002252 [Steccherinum ochraceum]